MAANPRAKKPAISDEKLGIYLRLKSLLWCSSCPTPEGQGEEHKCRRRVPTLPLAQERGEVQESPVRHNDERPSTGA